MGTQEHAAHAAHDDELEGVWVTAAGTRTEIMRDGDRWRAYVYLTLRGRTPGGQSEYRTADEVREAISRMEASGQIRQPGLTPSPPLDLSDRIAEQWTAGRMVAAAIIGALVLIVGLSLISNLT